MPNYDASGTTALNKSKRATRQYKDLDLSFGRNTVTNDVNKLTDVEAVKRSVRNLINTSHFERPFHPEIGSNVRAMLFEPMTPLTALNLQRKVQEVLVNFEPRIRLVQIAARPDIDRNSYDLAIYFYVIGSNELITVQTFLERLR
jgi:phage baseplate assembly protein W